MSPPPSGYPYHLRLDDKLHQTALMLVEQEVGANLSAVLRQALTVGMKVLATQSRPQYPTADEAHPHYGGYDAAAVAADLRGTTLALIDFINRYGSHPLTPLGIGVPQTRPIEHAPPFPDEETETEIVFDDQARSDLDLMGADFL